MGLWNVSPLSSVTSLPSVSVKGGNHSEPEERPDEEGAQLSQQKFRHLQDSNLRPHRGIDIDASSSLSL